MDAAIDHAGLVRLGLRVTAPSIIDSAVADAERLVADHHAAHPLELGMPVQELRSRLGGATEIVEAVLQRAQSTGRLRIESAVAAVAEWEPTLSPDDAREGARILETLRAAGREPPSVEELAIAHSAHAFSILRFFERSGLVAPVSLDRFYDSEALQGMIDALRKGMAKDREYTPQEIRDIIGVSRKFLIPFLEYCDRTGVTERRADGRVLAGAFRAKDRQVLA